MPSNESSPEDGEVFSSPPKLKSAVPKIGKPNQYDNKPIMGRTTQKRINRKSKKLNFSETMVVNKNNRQQFAKAATSAAKPMTNNYKKNDQRTFRTTDNDVDEFEMLCMRNVPISGNSMNYFKLKDKFDELSSDDDSSDDSNEINYNKRKKEYSSDKRYIPNENPQFDGICKSNLWKDCVDSMCKRSHEFRSVRIPKLCSSWLKGMCINGNKCRFMHSEFPCKNYYLGISNHNIDNCRFFHGGPLSDGLQKILLGFLENKKHPTLNAKEKMMEQHQKLIKEFAQSNAKTRNKTDDEIDPKHNLRNFVGLLTEHQINQFNDQGISSIKQCNNLTVKQLIEFGLNIFQIQEIQKCLVSNNFSPLKRTPKNNYNHQPSYNETGDCDMRILIPAKAAAVHQPTATVTQCSNDIDMRIGSSSYRPLTESFCNYTNASSEMTTAAALPQLTAHSIQYSELVKETIEQTIGSLNETASSDENQLVILDSHNDFDDDLEPEDDKNISNPFYGF